MDDEGRYLEHIFAIAPSTRGTRFQQLSFVLCARSLELEPPLSDYYRVENEKAGSGFTELMEESKEVAHFHDTFVNSGIRWGRLNEMEFMSFYELKNTLKDLKRMKFKAIYDELMAKAKLGLSLARRKRMHMGFQSAKGRSEIKRLYKKTKKKTV